MKESLEFIISEILGHQETKIEESVSSSGEIVFLIEPKSEDFGRLIGKNGKIINALRKLIRVKATKEGKRVYLKVQPGSP